MRVVFTLLVLLLASPSAFAQDGKPPGDYAGLRRQISAVLEQTNTPAIGIALVNKDGAYWVDGWGMADRESGRRADKDTLFRIGSISKMFAAFAILKLAEEGKLSLEDKVRDRVPEVQFENPWEATHPVRIVHLLEHTTGWDDTHMPEYAFSAPDDMSVKAGLEFHPHSRISRWPPGTRHSYCNSGAAVAAYIVEKLTGKRYEDYVAENFFQPLGMDSASYFKTPEYDRIGATLYLGDRPQPYWHLIYRPAGSINASATDMAKLVQFLLLRGATPNSRLLAQSSIDRMELPQTTLGNPLGVLAGYGLANYTTGHKALGLAVHGHNGGMNGGLSELGYVKELGEGYVFMINSGNGAALARISGLIREYLVRARHAPTPTIADLPPRFTNIDGFYELINPRVEALRFLFGLVGVMRVTHDARALHREPLLAGWRSSDRTAGPWTLVDAWSGLPTIAPVEDPLAGPTLQVGTDLYQRVPAWQVYLRILVLSLWPLLTLTGLVALLVWMVRRMRRKTADLRLWLRLWPLIASAALVGLIFTLLAAADHLLSAGTVSWLSVSIFVCTLLYPLAALLGAAQLFRPAVRARRNLPYWFAALFATVHLAIAGYLGTHGVIGLRIWT